MQHSQPAHRNCYFDEWLLCHGDRQKRQLTALCAIANGDKESARRVLSVRRALVEKYSYAIPNNDALHVIATFAPLIELGAGTGYWSWLLQQRGVDIVAYDLDPPQQPGMVNRFHPMNTCWTEVSRGDETVLPHHRERSLLLCWPPGQDPMAFNALKSYQGNTFLYIGQLPLARGLKGWTGDDNFFALLNRDWQTVTTVELPCWELCWDKLYVYRRRS
jgi:hypothetical protein